MTCTVYIHVCLLFTGKLSAIFRSSEKGRFKGFAINVICFRREDGDQEGCTEFTSNQTVTGNDTMTGNNTMLGNGTTTPSARSGADQGSNSRTKRSALDRFVSSSFCKIFKYSGTSLCGHDQENVS